MIIEIVTFPTPAGMTREAEYEGARHAGEQWIKNPELVAKHFMRDGTTSGAVYFWPSIEAAKRGHDEKFLEGFRKRNGCDPEIRYFEFMMTADAKAGTVIEYGEAMGAAAE
ncbi:MAG: hypothetical protein AB7F96_11420 [Beijerinckiaceae bacterium]